MATVIVKQKETEKELAKEIKEKRDEGTSWFVPKKKQRVKANPLCRTRLEKGITVHSTSVQKKVMEQEVTLSAVEGGRDVL